MNILIGNIISLIAAVFLAVSCTVKTRNKVFIMQFMNCALLAVASYFFGSYAAITTLVLCCIRNIFILKDKFTKPVMAVIITLVFIFGFMANNRGIVGLMPVFATVEYTLCCHFIRDVKKTRISVLFNESIWLIYSFLVRDYSTAMTDIAVITVDIFAIIKARCGKTSKTSEH